MPFAGVGADDAFDVALDTEGVLEHKVCVWGGCLWIHGLGRGVWGWGVCV